MPEFKDELASVLEQGSFQDLSSGLLDFPCGIHLNSLEDYRLLKADPHTMDMFDIDQEMIDLYIVNK